MIIVCSGPETFQARRRYAELVSAFRKKYDPSGNAVQRAEADVYKTVTQSFSAATLFSAKKMIVCEGLFVGMTPAQAKRLAAGVVADGEQTVVLDFESKPPSATLAGTFAEGKLLVYAYDVPKGSELTRVVSGLCSSYGVDVRQAPALITRFGDDLWAIDSALQVLRVDAYALEAVKQGSGLPFYDLVDTILAGDAWRARGGDADAHELLNTLSSQIRSWFMVRDGSADGIHPFVQKKLSSKRIKDPDVMALSFIRALASSRSSLGSADESMQLIP